MGTTKGIPIKKIFNLITAKVGMQKDPGRRVIKSATTKGNKLPTVFLINLNRSRDRSHDKYKKDHSRDR